LATSMGKTPRALWKKALRWVLGLACVAYIIVFLHQNRGDLEIVLKLRPLALVAVAALFCVHLALYSCRFQVVFEKCTGVAVPFLKWFRLIIIGRFLNSLVPQMGNVYRSVRLKEDHGVPYTSYATGLFSFIWLDVCLNFVFALVIVATTAPHMRIGGVGAASLLALMLALAVIVPAALALLFRLTKPRTRYLSWAHSKVSEVFSVSLAALRDRAYVLKVLLLSVALFASMNTILYMGFLSFGIRASLPALALFYALYKLSVYFVVTPGNVGLRELVYGLLSREMDIGMAEGIIVAAMLRIVAHLVLIGLALLLGSAAVIRHRHLYTRAGD